MKIIYISVSIISLLFSWRYTDLELKIHDVSPQLGVNVLLADDSGTICRKIDRVNDKHYNNDVFFKYTISLDKGWKHKEMFFQSRSNAHIYCFRDEHDPDNYYFTIHYYCDLIINDTLTVKMIDEISTDNCVLLKTDKNLNIQWVKNMSEDIHEIQEVKIDNEGSFIIAGFRYNKELKDYNTVILMLDKKHNVLWKKTMLSRYRNFHLSILFDQQDNLYFSYFVHTAIDSFVTGGPLLNKIRKFSKNGNLKWERTFPLFFRDKTQFILGPDSLLYMLSTEERSQSGSLHLVKMDLKGSTIFEKEIETSQIENLSLVDIDIDGNMYFSFHIGFMYGSIGDKDFVSKDEEYWEACYSESFDFIESRQKFLRLSYYIPMSAKYRGVKIFPIFRKYSDYNIFHDNELGYGYVKIYTADVPIFFNTKEKREKKVN